MNFSRNTQYFIGRETFLANETTRYIISSCSDLLLERTKEAGVESPVDHLSHDLPAGVQGQADEAVDGVGVDGQLVQPGELLLAVVALPVLHADLLEPCQLLHFPLRALLDVLLPASGQVGGEGGQVSLELGNCGLAPGSRALQPAQGGEHTELL